ncbi:hypothetical protein EDD36DRAFT_492439 [Exophiala viscosa]|uniref:Dystroglycan-type cadherin-like domain-containing protein n=1 Tax=Exophiala viscosa TaxID=2486360 RepID=A0AAN6E9D1_9EURO|nr:hypothetical protein EDD36DRAFT_492439 [Exophiala viscosa]
MVASFTLASIQFYVLLTILFLTRLCHAQDDGSSEPKPPGWFILPADSGTSSDGMVDYTFEYGSSPEFQWVTNDTEVDLNIYDASGTAYSLLGDTAQTSFNRPLVWSSDFGPPYGTGFYLQIVSEDTDYTIATSVTFTVVPAGSNPGSSSSPTDTSSATPTTTELINPPLTLPTTPPQTTSTSTTSTTPLFETLPTTNTPNAPSTTTSEPAVKTTTDTASTPATAQDTSSTSSSAPTAAQTASLPQYGDGGADTSSDPHDKALIVGLSTGLGLTVLSAALACLFLLRRHKQQQHDKQKNTPQAAEKANVEGGAQSHNRVDSYRLLPMYSPSDELNGSRFYSRSDLTGMVLASPRGRETMAELPSPPFRGIGKFEPDHLIELPG